MKTFLDFSFCKSCFPKFKEGLGKTRDELPQINQENINSFVEYLEKHNIEVKDSDFYLDTMDLIPSQVELNHEKVESIIKKIENSELTNLNKILISNDNYVLDGHHRVAAINKSGSTNHNTKFLQAQCCINELISLGNSYQESYKKNINEAKGEYQGREVDLNKPFRTGDKKSKFAVYVKNDKGNVIKVRFGDANMEIKRDDPARLKSFRARHNCDQKKDKTTPGYWSCQFWRADKSVSDLLDD